MQAISCSELIIIRLELASNSTVRYAFASRVLVCFVSQVICFLVEAKELMQSVRAYWNSWTLDASARRWALDAEFWC